MAEFLTIEIAVLNLKADATLEDVESTAGKTWADLVTTLKDYPVEGHRFFLGRQMQQESTAYLISTLWKPEDTNAFLTSAEGAIWVGKFLTLVDGFGITHVNLKPDGVEPFEAPVTEIATAHSVEAPYDGTVKRLLGLYEKEKPGFLSFTSGEVINPVDDANKTVHVIAGWATQAAPLEATGTSSEREEALKELASSGDKTETVYISFKEI